MGINPAGQRIALLPPQGRPLWPPAQTRRRDTDDAGGDKPRPYNAAYCAESDITSSQAGAALVAARPKPGTGRNEAGGDKSRPYG